MLNKYCDFNGTAGLTSGSKCTMSQFYAISDHKILLELFRCSICRAQFLLFFHSLSLSYLDLFVVCVYKMRNASIKTPHSLNK